ncbi:MAG TPA: hypothetical protein VL523_01240 [Terriglobia bacterium]|nr:hypothetical protein [Terriglobia bacterium]
MSRAEKPDERQITKPLDRETADVIHEETKRAKPQAKVLTVERRRKLRAAAAMLADPNCTLREYMAAIRELEPQETSPEFVQAVNLWHRLRGRS